MVLIAGQQLRLSANVKAALIAMQQAETACNGRRSTLKKRIGQDIEKLRALPNVDVPDINLRLDGVAGVVDSLPMLQDTHIHPTKPVADVTPNEGVCLT